MLRCNSGKFVVYYVQSRSKYTNGEYSINEEARCSQQNNNIFHNTCNDL
jgi:hypothetical protein